MSRGRGAKRAAAVHVSTRLEWYSFNPAWELGQGPHPTALSRPGANAVEHRSGRQLRSDPCPPPPRVRLRWSGLVLVPSRHAQSETRYLVARRLLSTARCRCVLAAEPCPVDKLHGTARHFQVRGLARAPTAGNGPSPDEQTPQLKSRARGSKSHIRKRRTSLHSMSSSSVGHLCLHPLAVP